MEEILKISKIKLTDTEYAIDVANSLKATKILGEEAISKVVTIQAAQTPDGENNLFNENDKINPYYITELADVEVKGDLTLDSAIKSKNSTVISDNTTALGDNSLAGVKGFYWKTYTRTVSGNIATWTFNLYKDAENTPALGAEVDNSVSGWVVGDILSVNGGNKYDKKFTIIGITTSGGIVKLTATSDSSISSLTDKYDTILDAPNNFSDNAIFCPAKPQNGIVDFGKYAFAAGQNAWATNYGATAFGRDTEAYGQYSTAVGRDTKAGYAAFATGRFAIAEGSNSTATGLRVKAAEIGAHAEGGSEAGATEAVDNNWTVASGKFSHAEGGSVKAIGNFSHAEGCFTTAAGPRSHAEGYNTKTEGEATHAEGYNTQALGSYSHTEGEGTVSTRSSQHVQGRYNALDQYGNSSEGAFIIGGGTSASNRKDIHILDWQGLAWYASDVVAGNVSLHRTSEATARAQSTADTAKNTAETANDHIGLRLTKANDSTGGAKGLGASSTASYGAALGWRCAVTGGHGMAFGACLTAAGGQTAFGKANAPTKKYKNASGEEKTAIFMIGNGSTDTGGNVTNPSNAFAVLGDGTGYLGDKKIITGNTAIKIGETELTEEQLKKILKFIRSVEIGG